MSYNNEKKYHIPRKVSEGFSMLGLNAKGWVVMLIALGTAALVLFAVPIPTGGKVVLSTLIVSVPYFTMTQELGNGLKVTEYLRLLIDFNLLSQREYSLTSSIKRVKEDEFPVLTYDIPDSTHVQREVLISEITNFDKEQEAVQKDQVRADREKELEELAQWIAKPKTLRRFE